MASESRLTRSLQHIYAHWPGYLLGYGTVVLLLLGIALSANRGWLAFIPIFAALLLIVSYFLAASLWLADRLNGREGVLPHHALFDMAQIQSTDTFVYVDLADRKRAVELGMRMTTGKVIVVDVYSPQLTPSHALIRRRRRLSAPLPDPRFEWCAGDINLLPLPDRSVAAVILCQALSQFWQQGDQQLLLREVYRILVPNGQVLVAEQTRTELYWLVMGPAALRVPPAAKWRELLQEAGFRVHNERELQGIIHCYRASKPLPTEGQQLTLQLNF